MEKIRHICGGYRVKNMCLMLNQLMNRTAMYWVLHDLVGNFFRSCSNLGRSALYALYIVPCAFTCWQNKNTLIMMHFARHCVCHTHTHPYIYIYMCIYSYSESRERLRCICDGATSVHLPVLASGIIIDISSYTSIYLYLYMYIFIYILYIYIYS